MKIDKNVDYRGMIVYATMPMQPLPGAAFRPTALQMKVDLAKAKIEAAYNPTELEYQRRLAESAQLKRRPRPC